MTVLDAVLGGLYGQWVLSRSRPDAGRCRCEAS